MKYPEATTSREDQLDAWLERVDANEVWSTKIRHNCATLTGYLINCQLVIVLRYASTGDGWELFVPPTTQNRIDATLDAAAELLKVDGCRGLTEGGAE